MKRTSVNTSPTSVASRKSPLTPFLNSPMRNLRLSDPTSPVPPSPSRKRQNSFRKKILSTPYDYPHESSDNSDEFETELANHHPKHRRFAEWKSETHVRRRHPDDRSNLVFETNRYVQSLLANRVRKESASLPCSPIHAMPPKWRFKQQQREEKSVRSLTPTSSRNKNTNTSRDLSKSKHSKGADAFADGFFVSQSRGRDVQAYQSSDQLIVITDDLSPGNDENMEVMDTPEVTSSTRLEKSNSKDSFTDYGIEPEEVKDVNELSCSSDDSVMLAENGDDPKTSLRDGLVPLPGDVSIKPIKTIERGKQNLL